MIKGLYVIKINQQTELKQRKTIDAYVRPKNCKGMVPGCK